MKTYEDFISYRRGDTLSEAFNLYTALKSKGRNVFFDMKCLDNGKFDEHLEQTVKTCTNYILVLGKDSLTRCSEKNDFLRLEISTALRFKKNIVCVFVGDFKFPDELPEDIASIKQYNGLTFNIALFGGFMEELLNRFITEKNQAKVSNESNDFDIENSTLLEYIGNAPIVKIPSGVRSIGKNAFKDKTAITEVIFNEELEEIGESAFERCMSITSLIFPDSLKSIGAKAFMRCFGLSAVIFNSALNSIDEEAFKFCTKLRVVQFEENLSHVASSAFNDCDRLLLFDVDNNNRFYSSDDGVLYDKEKKTLVRYPEAHGGGVFIIPAGVENLEPWSFSRCLGLSGINLPEGLKKIGEFAFYDCSRINSLILPSSLEDVEPQAFEGWSCSQKIVASEDFNKLKLKKIQRRIDEELNPNVDVPKEMPEFVMIKTAFESEDEAANMAKLLRNNRYAASVQLRRLNSFYGWEDIECNEQEIELSCITKGSLYYVVEKFIKERHSYECCQMICLPIINASEDFGNWINDNTVHR